MPVTETTYTPALGCLLRYPHTKSELEAFKSELEA